MRHERRLFEAFFQAVPSDAAKAVAWLQQWRPILDTVEGHFDRGASYLQVTSYGYSHSDPTQTIITGTPCFAAWWATTP